MLLLFRMHLASAHAELLIAQTAHVVAYAPMRAMSTSHLTQGKVDQVSLPPETRAATARSLRRRALCGTALVRPAAGRCHVGSSKSVPGKTEPRPMARTIIDMACSRSSRVLLHWAHLLPAPSRSPATPCALPLHLRPDMQTSYLCDRTHIDDGHQTGQTESPSPDKDS